MLPQVIVPPPGPKSKLLAETLARYENRNVTFLTGDFPVFWERGTGVNVWDADGNRYLDLTAGFAVADHGHACPEIVEATYGQAQRLYHAMGDVHPTAVKAELCQKLSQITVERDNDKNPVVALREIAEKAISPEDLKEELVHSLQKYVEVDEPEHEGVPLIGAPGTGVDADDTEVTTDRMSEEELLKGLEGLTPPESQPEPDADAGDEED